VATVGSAYLTLTGDIGAIAAIVAGLCMRLLRTSPSVHHASVAAATASPDDTDADADAIGMVPLHI